FSTREEAENAITMMNNRSVLDKKIRVNWATSATGGKKTDTSLHHHIFVGDLGTEITGEVIKNSFSKYGTISNCRVVRDGQTGKSKGYGFISYVQREDAERA
ncbi:hypothetical protein, partial [Salmonella sp. s51228]|uniref:hypothetical protein n=1 Tax=Salmonella sp. s51228 TaxID=3159652 RepID=UPI00398071E6